MARKVRDDDVTCAILGNGNVPVLCSLERFSEWTTRNQERCLLRQDNVGNWVVVTLFDGMCFNADGPPLFFIVKDWLAKPAEPGAPRESAFIRHWGTFEDAVRWHEALVDQKKRLLDLWK
jgi:hypothetical protein